MAKKQYGLKGRKSKIHNAKEHEPDLDQQLLDKEGIIDYLSDLSNLEMRKTHKTRGVDILLSNLETVYEGIVEGLPIDTICNNLGITRSSRYYAKQNSKYFNKLLESAQLEQVKRVKQSLISKTKDKYVLAEKVLPNGRVVQYQKFLPSDFNAIKFYLLNKVPEEFKDRQEITVNKTDIIVDIVDDVIDVDFEEN